MNTFKKLVFGLLLSGMAFTVACGDNTEKKPGDPCDKADACGADLKCVIKDEKDTKGKCAVACTEQNKGNKCTGDTKTCGDAMEHGKKKTDPKVKVCMAGATDDKKDVGGDCVAGSNKTSEMCVDSAVCHNSKCYQKCENLGDASDDCKTAVSGADGTTAARKCAEEGGVKMCVAPGGGNNVGVQAGNPCENAENKKCAEGLFCIVEGSDDTKGVCRAMTPCDETACTADAMKECQDVKVATGTTPLKTCGDKAGTAAVDAACDNSAVNMKCAPDLVCVIANDGDTTGTCKQTCDPATPCTDNTKSCTDAKVLADSTPGKICQ